MQGSGHGRAARRRRARTAERGGVRAGAAAQADRHSRGRSGAAGAGGRGGGPATTHWMHADAFRALFPQVKLDPDVLYVDDGDVLTSAGNAAGIDLCLHLVRRDHGATVANRVARRSVVAPWREGGQSQFMEPVPDPDGPGTAPTRAWALERLRE